MQVVMKRIKKIRKKIGHAGEYIVLRFFELVVSIIPRSTARGCGAVIGYVLYRMNVYRRVVECNMAHVDIVDAAFRSRLIRQLYRNTCIYFVEFLMQYRRMPEYEIENEESIDAAIKKNRGVVVICAHIGNWELLADIFGSRIEGLHVLFKPMKNPYVQGWLLRRRKRTGTVPVFQRGAMKKIRRILGRNQVVAALIDQHAGRHGTRIPFLSKPANTTRAIAAVCKKTECAVIGARCVMKRDGTYRIVLERLDRDSEAHATVEDIQRRHNDMISGWIREYPAHWFGWYHKRYRGAIEY